MNKKTFCLNIRTVLIFGGLCICSFSAIGAGRGNGGGQREQAPRNVAPMQRPAALHGNMQSGNSGRDMRNNPREHMRTDHRERQEGRMVPSRQDGKENRMDHRQERREDRREQRQEKEKNRKENHQQRMEKMQQRIDNIKDRMENIQEKHEQHQEMKTQK